MLFRTLYSKSFVVRNILYIRKVAIHFGWQLTTLPISFFRHSLESCGGGSGGDFVPQCSSCNVAHGDLLVSPPPPRFWSEAWSRLEPSSYRPRASTPPERP